MRSCVFRRGRKWLTCWRRYCGSAHALEEALRPCGSIWCSRRCPSPARASTPRTPRPGRWIPAAQPAPTAPLSSATPLRPHLIFPLFFSPTARRLHDTSELVLPDLIAQLILPGALVTAVAAKPAGNHQRGRRARHHREAQEQACTGPVPADSNGCGASVAGRGGRAGAQLPPAPGRSRGRSQWRSRGLQISRVAPRPRGSLAASGMWNVNSVTAIG